MADEQNTQTTQATEQTAALSGGGDPNTSTQSFAQSILGDVNPDGIVRKTGAQGAAKTFTQDEVNDLIKARVQRERRGLPGKEELEAFHKWQDDQKSAEQKSAEAIKAQSDRAEAAEKKAAALEAKLLATSKGVKTDAADDVVALASLKVSDDMPLEKAIDEVLNIRSSREVQRRQQQGFPAGTAAPLFPALKPRSVRRTPESSFNSEFLIRNFGVR